MKLLLSLVKFFHLTCIHKKRIIILSKMAQQWISSQAILLDIGCGDGFITKKIKENLPKITVLGVEVKKRQTCLIPYTLFDGKKIPLKNNSVDICLFVDVLHHTKDIQAMINEAVRVSKQFIIIKDHLCETKYDKFILKVMDWIGNKPDNIAILSNYCSTAQWQKYISKEKLKVRFWTTNLPIYSFPLNIIFGSKLHCFIVLEKISSSV